MEFSSCAIYLIGVLIMLVFGKINLLFYLIDEEI